MARFLIFERDKESEQNGSTMYLLYGESHCAKLEEVAAKNHKSEQEGLFEEVYFWDILHAKKQSGPSRKKLARDRIVLSLWV